MSAKRSLYTRLRTDKRAADRGKQVTAAYYGKPQDYAYFTGCSSGGRQALKEAQMFPDDYNGIIAGDPANNWVLPE